MVQAVAGSSPVAHLAVGFNAADRCPRSRLNSETARRALEEICSGRDLEGIPDVYHDEFVDHVNAVEYRGHEGALRSVSLYLELFPDLRFTVDEQVTEGDRVAARWTLNGTHRGRRVTLRGIVISRFEDGRIIEDWAASDTMEILRQLGIWRSILLLVRHRKLQPPFLRATEVWYRLRRS